MMCVPWQKGNNGVRVAGSFMANSNKIIRSLCFLSFSFCLTYECVVLDGCGWWYDGICAGFDARRVVYAPYPWCLYGGCFALDVNKRVRSFPVLFGCAVDENLGSCGESAEFLL